MLTQTKKKKAFPFCFSSVNQGFVYRIPSCQSRTSSFSVLQVPAYLDSVNKVNVGSILKTLPVKKFISDCQTCLSGAFVLNLFKGYIENCGVRKVVLEKPLV